MSEKSRDYIDFVAMQEALNAYRRMQRGVQIQHEEYAPNTPQFMSDLEPLSIEELYGPGKNIMDWPEEEK